MKTKVIKVDKKIPDATTLIHINQYNTDKQNLEKKIGDVHKKYRTLMAQWLLLFFNTKISKVKKKMPVVNQKTIYDTKVLEIKGNSLLLLIIISLQVTNVMQR